MSTVNMADVFVGLANRWGDRPAIVSPEINLTFRGLVDRAARSAHELRARGIPAGANIGIAPRDSGEMIVLMIATWMLGGTAVPIDFRTPAREMSSLAKQFDLAAILDARRAPADCGYESISVGEAWPEAIARHAATPPDYSSYSTPAVISLTSGTTGRPIGFLYSHEKFLLMLVLGPDQGRVSPGGILVNPVSPVYLGSRCRTFNHLLGGGTLHMEPPLIGAREFAQKILATNATQAYCVPPIARKLLELREDGGEPLFPNLRVLFSAGAPMTAAEKSAVHSRLSNNFIDYYGASICGAISSLYGEDLAKRPDTVGRVLPNVHLQIVDESGEPMPPGEAGIIRLRSPAMADGIYGGDERSSGDRLKDGWAYTGDVGAIDRDGFLMLLGRTTDMIIRSGVNVHPEEVESVLSEFPGVHEVAVAGVPAPVQGEEIAAFVVAADGVTESALLAHCRDRLSHDKRPRIFVFVPKLPRNANGKVLRTELRSMLKGTAARN